MTPLHSPVERETTLVWKNRQVLVKLRPDNQIELRLKGLRTSELKIPLLDLLKQHTGAHTTEVAIKAGRR